MGYVYGAAKKIAVQGLVFHVKVGWAGWAKIELAVARLLVDAQKYTRIDEELDGREAAQEKQQKPKGTKAEKAALAKDRETLKADQEKGDEWKIELEERGQQIKRQTAACIIGWEDEEGKPIRDEEGKVVPFSMDAFLGDGEYASEGVDIAIVNELITRLQQQGEQVRQALVEENPT